MGRFVNRNEGYPAQNDLALQGEKETQRQDAKVSFFFSLRLCAFALNDGTPSSGRKPWHVLVLQGKKET